MSIISDCSVVLGHVDPVPLVNTLPVFALCLLITPTRSFTSQFSCMLQVNWFRSHRLIPARLLMLGHLELFRHPAAAEVDAMFSRFPRLGSETPTSAGTDLGDKMYSILNFFPRHAQWVGTFGNRVRHLFQT